MKTICCAQVQTRRQQASPVVLCNGNDPDCSGPEICDNNLDDDCDGSVDCGDSDCFGAGPAEDCSDGVDNDCDGPIDCADSECLASNGAAETCNDNKDDDCSGPTNDDIIDECRVPWRDDDHNGEDDNGDGNPDDEEPEDGPCDEQCGRCAGQPVDLLMREAFIGPHEDIRIASPQGGAFDIVVSRSWSSRTAETDKIKPGPVPLTLGLGWRSSLDIRLMLEEFEETSGPFAGKVAAVVLRSPTDFVRLHRIAADQFGRHPTRDVQAFRTAATSTWTVVLEDGTQLDFVEGAGTTMHPDLSNDPLNPLPQLGRVRHLRVREIRPEGSRAIVFVSTMRETLVRMYHPICVRVRQQLRALLCEVFCWLLHRCGIRQHLLCVARAFRSTTMPTNE